MSDIGEGAARIFRRPDWLRRFIKRYALFNRLLTNVIPRYRMYAVRADSDLVIEGVPRSANTFAVVALKMAQPAPIKVGRHLHSIAHVRRGVQLGKPTLVVIRQPRECILSHAILEPQFGLELLLKEYIEFYEGVERLGESVTLGEFREITNNYGVVIRRLNERFGTHFREFDSSAENIKRCYELIDEEERQKTGKPARPIYVSRPTEEREAKKCELASALDEPSIQKWVVKAEQVYARLLRQHNISPPAVKAENASPASAAP
jgi:hypothetical protein